VVFIAPPPIQNIFLRLCLIYVLSATTVRMESFSCSWHTGFMRILGCIRILGRISHLAWLAKNEQVTSKRWGMTSTTWATTATRLNYKYTYVARYPKVLPILYIYSRYSSKSEKEILMYKMLPLYGTDDIAHCCWRTCRMVPPTPTSEY
jgi:hypothetical protein